MNALRLTLSAVFVSLLVVTAATSAVGATLTLNPTADTYVRGDNVGSVAGSTAAELLVGQLSATQAMHALLSFDLSDIPVGATINAVSLTMRQSSEDGSSANVTLTLNLHALTQTFVSAQTSWNNLATGTAWTTAGGTFDSTVLSSVAVRTRPSQSPVLTLPIDQTWASTDSFVAAVQSAADGSNSIGFLFKDANEANSGRELIKFFSSDGTTAPQLVIDYTAAAIPEPATAVLLTGLAVLAGGVGLRRRSH